MSNGRTRSLSRRTVLAAGALASVAGVLTSREAHAQTWPELDLRRDFGAVGDGVADDTPAFQRAAWAISRTPEKGAVLTIPSGTYRVGQQLPADELDDWIDAQAPYIDEADLRADMYESFRVSSPMRAWRVALPIFHIGSRVGLQHLEIRGNGATMRLTEGLLFGGYVPAIDHGEGEVPGTPRDETRASSPTGFERLSYGVEAGRMIQVYGGRNIAISDLILDGSSDTLKLGGKWGDTGRQLKATGLRLMSNTDVTITNVETRNHGLDGITIAYPQAQHSDPVTPHTLVNVVSEYNGRQALSWTGGRGLKAVNCEFNHTGRVVNTGGGEGDGQPLASLPGAGIDIEPESGGLCLDATFVNCTFYNNWGAGMVTTSHERPVVTNIGNISFTRCHFWGSDNWTIYSWGPTMSYRNCAFHGSVALRPGRGLNADTAHQFLHCTFDDVSPDPSNQAVYIGDDPNLGYTAANSHLVNAEMPYLNLDHCTVRARGLGSIFSTNSSPRTLTNCTVHHDFDGSVERSSLATLRGWSIRRAKFHENISTAGSWQIVAEDVTVLGTGTRVEGGQVLWNGELSGAIPAG
ncbi:glycosyl hydrolase family 28-related protein [Ruania alba]|uniref:Right handed beta helix region n=1 Tax=Ruania alba TaxID=648782 RepID=A0A1H5N1J5_9MICO|nr:glycosyl hydrolase family 28-related protein [Ruania alba]SEE95386.1 Right handed beta helix region [Ruania alba]